jgi:hypothetical protein
MRSDRRNTQFALSLTRGVAMAVRVRTMAKEEGALPDQRLTELEYRASALAVAVS